jgi:hypothetical protein
MTKKMLKILRGHIQNLRSIRTDQLLMRLSRETIPLRFFLWKGDLSSSLNDAQIPGPGQTLTNGQRRKCTLPSNNNDNNL